MGTADPDALAERCRLPAASSGPPVPSTTLQAIAALSILFTVAYCAFVALSPRITAWPKPPPLSSFTPWVRWAAREHDGMEVYVAFFGSLVYFGLVYFLVRNRKLPTALGQPIVVAASLVLVASILLQTNSSELVPLKNGVLFDVMIVIGLIILIFSWHALYQRFRNKTFRWLGSIPLWLTLTGIVLLSLRPAPVGDYGFFIGPALKRLQGEPFNTFYMQYSLLGTYLFMGMVKLGLTIQQMQLVIGMTFVLWFGLYYWLARRLLRDRFLPILFIVCLLAVRFLWPGNPEPQVSPIRLELWVPLLIVVDRYGLLTLRTAAAFAICYAVDSSFGLLYMIVYYVAITIVSYQRWRVGEKVKMNRLLLLLLPAALAVVFQTYIFGSVFSPGTDRYLHHQLGFLPITEHSLFWIVFMLMTVCLGVLSWEADRKRKELDLMVFAIALVQLIYFFGRSHDHNLLHLSGALLLVLFMGIDGVGAVTSDRWTWVAGSMVLTLAAIGGGEHIASHLAAIRFHLGRGMIVDPHPFEEAIESSRASLPAERENLHLIGPTDAYMNYRYGVPQRGKVVPFEANVYMEDTAQALTESLENHRRVMSWGVDVSELNQSAYLRRRELRFTFETKGPWVEVHLEPHRGNP